MNYCINVSEFDQILQLNEPSTILYPEHRIKIIRLLFEEIIYRVIRNNDTILSDKRKFKISAKNLNNHLVIKTKDNGTNKKINLFETNGNIWYIAFTKSGKHKTFRPIHIRGSINNEFIERMNNGQKYGSDAKTSYVKAKEISDNIQKNYFPIYTEKQIYSLLNNSIYLFQKILFLKVGLEIYFSPGSGIYTKYVKDDEFYSVDEKSKMLRIKLIYLRLKLKIPKDECYYVPIFKSDYENVKRQLKMKVENRRLILPANRKMYRCYQLAYNERGAIGILKFKPTYLRDRLCIYLPKDYMIYNFKLISLFDYLSVKEVTSITDYTTNYAETNSD